MIIGIIFVVLAVVAFIIICILSNEELCLNMASFMSGILAMLGFFIICEKLKLEKTEFEYPTTEYTLEYEVIIRGEQIDSTYVISKIE